MTFFVTSVGPAKARTWAAWPAPTSTARLAQAAGAGAANWRAYLSTQATGGTAAVNARDRIGRGPGRTPKAW